MNISPVDQVRTTFVELHQLEPQLIATAPGRVNLIGEHTDYNDGFVFPVAIQFHTAVAAHSRVDRWIVATACDQHNEQVRIDLDAPAKFDPVAPWSNYLRGVIDELRRAGYSLGGADLVISGNVPMGAGLSSSASLEMAIVRVLTQLSDEAIDASTAARIGQAAENNFVGCQCGIMDQLISAAGRAGHAMHLDCRSLQQQHTPLPDELSLLVVDSRLSRRLVDGEYNERRRQCEEVAKVLGVPALRDLSLQQLTEAKYRLDPVSYRRAHHVISENQRTLDFAEALSRNDGTTLSQLMAASHRSMRDDFEITVPAIDKLVDLMSDVIGTAGGVRMTGGGFGGCVVALLPQDLIAQTQAKIAAEYPAFAGHQAEIFVCQASGGAFV